MKFLVGYILLLFMVMSTQIDNIHGAPGGNQHIVINGMHGNGIINQIIQRAGSNSCGCPDPGCDCPDTDEPTTTKEPTLVITTPNEPTTLITTTTTKEPTTVIPTTTTEEPTTTDYCDIERTTFCPDGSRCHANATCVLSYSIYFCKCNLGYAGDGADCGEDRDYDSWPDYSLFCCIVQDHCDEDNCLDDPNSGQEDSDNDGIGDACDYYDPYTIYNGTIYNGTTIMPTTLVPSNYCIPININNCHNISDAWRTRDSDGDGHMDSCDNCPYVDNVDQNDTDDDRVGDACDTDQDSDNDGVQDGIDNCINVVNPEQSDADYDGIGDKCDNDADDDGIPNDTDNCKLVPNPGQEDDNNDGFGNVCQNDKDGDCAPDRFDVCPENSIINKVDFRHFFRVDLDHSSGQPLPEFIISDNGREIIQTLNSKPGLMYGEHTFSGVDFDGTFHIGTGGWDDDYAGFIFSYQSSKTFYVVMWKRGNQYWWNGNSSYGEAGLQLKKVHSITGPGVLLADALWKTGDSTDQVRLLWHDDNKIPWHYHSSYRWQLIHRPHIGLIRFRFITNSTIIADSGNIYDNDILGGRLGVYCHSQEDITWSNLVYSCNDHSVPQEVFDDLPYDIQANVTVDLSKTWSGTVRTVRMGYEPPSSFIEPGLDELHIEGISNPSINKAKRPKKKRKPKKEQKPL